MRVTFNSFSDQALTYLNRQGDKTAGIQSQIASGQKISRPDQDPQIAETVLSLQAASAQQSQYYQNIGYALSVSQTSYNAIDAIRKVADRAGEIATSTYPLTPAEGFTASAKEVDSLIEQTITASNSQFDGKYLLSGTKTDTQPFAVTRDASGQVTGVSYQGAAQGASVQISDSSSASPFVNGTNNAQIGDFINQLVALRDNLKNNDYQSVTNQRPALQGTEDNMLATIAEVGSMQKFLQSSQEATSDNYDSITNRLGSANDVDVAKAVVDLTKAQTAYQAGLQTTTKVLQHSLLDYVQ